MCHHHPQQHADLQFGDQDAYDVMKNGQLLLDLLGSGEYGQWLVIHGHKHHPRICYASGGTTAPIIFSAGSLCAELYLELQTRARNQFYVITFPYGDYDRTGFVGTFQAWDWASGVGWIPAGQRSGLPARGGFGYRGDIRRLARSIAHVVNGAGADHAASWQLVVEGNPEVQFLLPVDFGALRRELDATYQLAIFELDGQPKQIGPKT